MANPRGAMAADGRLWIATDDGVAIVDPEGIVDNPVQPPVAIEELAVDGNPVDLFSQPTVAFRGRLVRITYTGLSLVAPERVRFRYKLEGLDPDWTDAGTVRTAVLWQSCAAVVPVSGERLQQRRCLERSRRGSGI